MINGDGHDPGGKVRLRLLPGVSGDAVFTDKEHRQLMRRWTGEVFPERYIMFIGMNPSTADASVNDPTCAREWTFAVREGYTAMVKANVGDYRATDPKMLLQPGVVAASEANLPTIRRAAAGADKVVLCHGKLNRALAQAGHDIVAALQSDGVRLWCFGTNADGSPKHPLYLRMDTPLIKFGAD